MAARICDARAIRFNARRTTRCPWAPLSFSTRRRASASFSRAMARKDVFVHVSAVEKAGMGTLNEGQKVSYEIVTERGKQAAGNLKPA